jgi:hypothetical protein
MSMRAYAYVLLAVVLAFGGGWLVGASGTSDLAQDRDRHLMQAQAAQAEALLLGARVSLFETNFGDAGERLDRAALPVSAVQTSLRESGQAERAGRLEIVATQIRDAAVLARQFDGAAQSAIDGAIAGLRAAMTAAPPD